MVQQVFAALKKHNLEEVTEMTIVDDNSNDGTVQKVEELKKSYPVDILVRTTEKGLSSAVLRGFELSRGEYLLCMDADLQHPPEKVPDMLLAFREKDVEFVLGTRYGGKAFAVDKDWPWYRKVISQGARALARPLTPLTDPMSGFFAIRKDVLQRAKNINNVGFKIALELYVKSRVKKHVEVPIFFGLRVAGESKLTGKVMLHYTQHLLELYPFIYQGFYVILLFLILLFLFIFYKLIINFI
uniref:Dolichol-phosphate mannosyltransferase subunit 1 n=1 Tax=Arcella intermedia TaxID=1963864 RepID=A0A6B2LEG7_9EUKA